MNQNSIEQAPAYQALTSVFMLGFKFLVWINAMGVLLVIFCALGLIQTDLTPFMLRLPLALFMAGLALCGVGLLWSCVVQTSLFSQLISGRPRRTHWLPMFLALIAYSLGMIAFIVGCWFTLNLAAIVYHDSDSTLQSYEGGAAALDQWGKTPKVTLEFQSRTVALGA